MNTNHRPKGNYHMLSTTEVAEELGVSTNVVTRFINTGLLIPDVTLHPSRTGRTGARKFKLETVHAFAASPYFKEYMRKKYWR